VRYHATTFAALLVVALIATVAESSVAQTGQMPKPDNHQIAEFLLEHGGQAQQNIQMCGVCHARDYCSGCHVNAQDVPAIQALEPSSEVADYVARKIWPAPASHTPFWLDNHKAAAAGATETCTTCHVVEQQCQSCHLGSETLERSKDATYRTGVDTYHPLNFMQQHSAAAFNQETECASCHNPEVFCRSCHASLGAASRDGRTDTGFHNESPNFQFGHGQAARQGLESCAACHAQQDCLACHSAKAGRNINPHGPDFDAKHLQDKNKGFCLLCHFSGQLP
jgi:hypothetical protein